MRPERQIELLERVADAGPHLAGLHADASAVHPASEYTDPDRFESELRVLFRDRPVLFALGTELREPGSYRSDTIGGIPLIVVRQTDGTLRAMVNACRHRAAPVVAPNSDGEGLTALACPYHLWTYELDGTLRARPGSAGAFDDVTLNCDLHRVPVAERYGMIFVRPAGGDPIDVDDVLSGAEDDLGSFGLDGYVHIESRVIEWKMNWKLMLDTFTEAYHIRALHKTTIAPAFDSNCVIFEAFGPNLVSIGLRKEVVDELRKPRGEWSLIPYGTIQYLIVPNVLIVHQLDHVEVWRIDPQSVATTRATVSIFAPSEPESEGSRQYFVKNLELLLDVTGAEDFPMMEQIQKNLESGAIPQLVYGRIEPPLLHFHRAVNELLASADAG